jgi:hypothetical protein
MGNLRETPMAFTHYLFKRLKCYKLTIPGGRLIILDAGQGLSS